MQSSSTISRRPVGNGSVTHLSDPAQDVPNACPQCGTSLIGRNEEMDTIAELQAQVRILTNRAADAVDKLADYEDEMRKIKSARPQIPPLTNPQVNTDDKTNETSSSSLTDQKEQRSVSLEEPAGPSAAPPSNESSFLQYRPSVKGRFPSFLTRSNTVRPATSASSLISTRESDLAAQLTQERTLRQEAEGKISQMSSEMEDLSVTLFQQANEMVASERQARAALEQRSLRFEERCGKLEDKVRVLEKRDVDKRARLERLEGAIPRIERARKLLNRNAA